MHPFQFGSSNKTLYGTYHPPLTKKMRDTCVLLCPPIAYEYQQSWWAYKQLANRLAKQGFPTLKFDYFATGNSQGETHEGNIDQWQDDISAAAQTLLDQSGKKKLALVGLRFGATLAALSLKKLNPSVSVLWDLIISGEHYLKELNAIHQQKLEIMGHPPSSHQNEYHGYIFSDSLITEIQAIDLLKYESWINNQTEITLLSPPKNRSHQHLATHLKDNGYSINAKNLEDISKWEDLKSMESFILPSNTIKTICDIFTGLPND
jgi:hypothetical protein